MQNTTTATTKNEIKQIAQNMETLAREVQVRLTADNDILDIANELVRNSSTFVFTLGEHYALKQVGSSKTRKGTVVASTVASGTTGTGSTPTGTVVSGTTSTVARNYHNVRDTAGRFTRKV